MNNFLNAYTEHIFPLPLYIGSLNNIDDAKFLYEEILADKDKMVKNTYNWFSKDTYILNRLKDTNLYKEVKQHIHNYKVNVLGIARDSLELEFTQSWLNFNYKNDTHHRHYHSFSVISGVIYFNASGDLGKFRLHKYQTPEDNISVYAETFNEFNNPDAEFYPSGGDLYLFPSHLYHSVSGNTTDDVRISLAFNTFWKGHASKSDSPWDLTTLIV